MSNAPGSPAARGFLVDQVRRLEPFEFVRVANPTSQFVVIEIGRSNEGTFEVRVPPRLPGAPLDVPMRAKLLEAGFHSADASNPMLPWIAEAVDGERAVDVAIETLADVFAIEIGEQLDLVHGSHQAEYEAVERLTGLRSDVEAVLVDMLGHLPERDADGDYVCPIDHVNVVVAPRVIPNAIALVRVFAITNADVNVTPELGILLARLNFGLMFGRFALDVEHRAIWFDETVLGDEVTEHQLRFTIEMVVSTASEWTDRLQHMFGGRTPHDVAAAPGGSATKPGTAGYL